MNEWLSWNMPLHALGGAAFLLVWKLVEEIPAVRKRMEWIDDAVARQSSCSAVSAWRTKRLGETGPSGRPR